MSNEELGWEDSLGDIVSPGDIVAGKYRVDRMIGTGGMGLVVEAWHMHFEERVAIKFLLPQKGADREARERFEREARAAFKIKSEHVARVIDVGQLDGRVPYMVMEYLEGQDLGVMLSDRRGFPIADAVELVMQAIEAVAEAHTQGIVHRDLKPENLYLTRRTDGTPCIKVLDFGLSKVASTPQQRERALTATTQVMGTPQYMSPEQWMSAKDVGPSADQWALGVILYELVTGMQPFDEEHLAQLCTKVLRGEPLPVARYRPDAPAGLETVILRCLRKDPGDRYANVGELALELYPYGPQRARASARRIAGVFSRAGVQVGDVPDSLRGGLGAGMVLGGIARAPSHDSAPTIVTPPSDAARDFEARGPSSSRTQLLADVLPLDAGRPAAASAPGPGAGFTASDSGQWHAPQAAYNPMLSSGEIAQQDSGRYQAYNPGPAGDSGRFHALADRPSGAATMPLAGRGMPAGMPARPRRPGITAQSWQHVLTPPDQGRRKMAFVVFGAVVVVAGVAILALVLPAAPSDADAQASAGVASEQVSPAAEHPMDEVEPAADDAPAETEDEVEEVVASAEPPDAGAPPSARPAPPPPRRASPAPPPPPGGHTNPFRTKSKQDLPPGFYNTR